MAKKNGSFKGKTHIMFVLDKSGSMSGVRDATISGFNEWLATMQKEPGAFAFTLTLFDTVVATPVAGEDLAKVAELDRSRYAPDGMTALYDAIGAAVKATEANVGEKDRALVVIMTDGQENSSREMTRQSVFDLIKEHEARGNWTFTYLSCHPDAYADAARIGARAGNVANYVGTVQGTKAAMLRVAHSTVSYSGAVAQSTADFYAGEPEDDPLPAASSWVKR